MQFKGKSRFDGKNRFRPQNTHKVTHSFCGQLGEALFYRGFVHRKADCQQLLRPSETVCGGISSACCRFFQTAFVSVGRMPRRPAAAALRERVF